MVHFTIVHKLKRPNVPNIAHVNMFFVFHHKPVKTILKKLPSIRAPIYTLFFISSLAVFRARRKTSFASQFLVLKHLIEITHVIYSKPHQSNIIHTEKVVSHNNNRCEQLVYNLICVAEKKLGLQLLVPQCNNFQNIFKHFTKLTYDCSSLYKTWFTFNKEFMSNSY